MGAHVGADGREGVAISYYLECLQHLSLRNEIDILADLHVQRAGNLAWRSEAVSISSSLDSPSSMIINVAVGQGRSNLSFIAWHFGSLSCPNSYGFIEKESVT
jgi:hypothetical protein